MPELVLGSPSQTVGSLRQCHRTPSFERDGRADGLHVEREVAPVGLPNPSRGLVRGVFECDHDVRFPLREDLDGQSCSRKSRPTVKAVHAHRLKVLSLNRWIRREIHFQREVVPPVQGVGLAGAGIRFLAIVGRVGVQRTSERPVRSSATAGRGSSCAPGCGAGRRSSGGARSRSGG